ncbi:MAG TPA: hypothetical protein VEH27_00540 [Methylomirabilota bacterium]|nr:hypothetical protein [Methylomirabilota bacterium]
MGLIMPKPPKTKQHYAPASPGFAAGKREWDMVLERARKRAPAFFESTEYKRLDPHDTALTTVVIRHFGEYLLKLQRNASLFPDNAKHKKELQQCYDLVEELSGSPDSEVRGLITNEIFFAVRKGDPIEEDIFKGLKPRSRELFNSRAR